MLSLLLAGIHVLAVSTALAQTFTALDDTPGWTGIDPCIQRTCLSNDEQYDTLEQAKSSCQLSNKLDVVGTCAQMQCKVNDTLQDEATSLVASFCSSVSTEYGLSVTSTVPTAPATTDASDVTPAPFTTSSSLTDTVTTPSATGSNASHDPVTATATPGPSSAATVTTSQATGNATSTPERKQVSGLTSSQKVGIGAGVGLGIPIFFGLIAALFFFTRRRKSKGAGPYGPVMTSDKGVGENGSYGGHGVEPHEMQHMGSSAPFLPAIATRDMVAKQPEYEETPQTARSYEETPQTSHSYEQQAPPQPDPYAVTGRPATSRDVSRTSTPPLDIQTRPMTAPQHLEPVEDEPPSPVSPVSPISAAGSRPGSLRHSREHDLR